MMNRKHASVLVAAVLAVAGTPQARSAGTVTTRFSVRLVVEPACPGDAPKVVASDDAALMLARRHLGDADLAVEHDAGNTGYWRVSSADGTALRISKCTGEVAIAEPESRDSRSEGQPAAPPDAG